jgi:hypothetical protein
MCHPTQPNATHTVMLYPCSLISAHTLRSSGWCARECICHLTKLAAATRSPRIRRRGGGKPASNSLSEMEGGRQLLHVCEEDGMEEGSETICGRQLRTDPSAMSVGTRPGTIPN